MDPEVKTRLGKERLPQKRAGRPSKEGEAALSETIIKTATALFAANGYAGASVEKVAASCRVGKDTIYRRFPSKAALFEGVLERLRSDTMKKMEVLASVDEHADALETLKNTTRWMLSVNLLPDFIALKRIVLSEEVVFGQYANKFSENDPLMTQYIALVVAAQKAGYLVTDLPARVLAEHLINGIITGPVLAVMLGDRRYDDAQELEQYFQLAWNLCLKGITGSNLLSRQP